LFPRNLAGILTKAPIVTPDALWREALELSFRSERQRVKESRPAGPIDAIRYGEEISLVADATGGMTFKSLRSRSGENNVHQALP